MHDQRYLKNDNEKEDNHYIFGNLYYTESHSKIVKSVYLVNKNNVLLYVIRVELGEC